ncbi:unnamed protein product [Triticum turgidum subsp. durum]|uniref:K-box domain-containing protein n=1 Tax=Triticum turgidum subsp. durum TaxID=4567 RepID=A0A9R0V4B4_TRITD|nr:unnamed protein product [Triticum turgidum subsp. durum]
MRRMTIATGATLLLKTRAFLSFHISHPTRNNREDRAFVGSVLSERTASHQDFTESNRSHGAVWIASPSHEKTAFQIRTEKRHLKISVKATIERYKKATSDTSSAGTVAEINAQHYQQESAKLKQQITTLQNSNRTLIGDTMATMSHRDLKQLEGRLDKGLGKIRARKNELLCAEIEYMQRREMELQNNNFFLREKVAETERGQQQTLNMMGAASTSNEYEQNMIHCDPRTFLQFNFMQQQPQYYSQQEDRKSLNSGKIFF